MTLDEALDGAAGADAAAPGLLVVMSYEALRADADWAAGRPWHYCVLDEGHVIRNPRARVAQAAKRVSAQHRLILSGTPIQNDVLELWALFDFLMPGFLGGQAAFRARYGRALTEARGSRAGAAAAQAGLLALDGLHKQVPRPAPPRPASGGLVPAAQGCPGAVPPCACFARRVRPCSAGMVLQPLGPRTAAGRRRRACRWGAPAAAAGQADRARRPQVMPFILRRTKDAVLDDLPPKIVQDVLCDPSPLQLRLYEDFARSAASAEAAGALAAGGGGVAGGAPGGGAPHVFQARLATAGVMRQGCAAQHVSAGIGAGAASARCHMGAAGCSLAVAASPHQHARAAQLLVHRLRPLLMPACAAVAHRRGGAGCEAVLAEPARAPRAQALQYLRRLCSHPLLVLDRRLPQHAAAVAAATGVPVADDDPAAWPRAEAALRELRHAPKLAALRELLQARARARPRVARQGAQTGHGGKLFFKHPVRSCLRSSCAHGGDPA